MSDVFRSNKFTRHGACMETGYTLTEMLLLEGQNYITKTKQNLQQVNPSSLITLEMIYQQINTEIDFLPYYATEAISDIWDGITTGSVKGVFLHTRKEQKYWSEISVGTEGFAEMFEATVHNPERYRLFKQCSQILINYLSKS